MVQQDFAGKRFGAITRFPIDAVTEGYVDDPLPGGEGPAAIFSEPCPVPVRSLLPADSPRRAGECIDHVRMLARIDVHLPPIIVHRPTMRVIDGMHRLGAARLRGDDHVEVRFFEGTVQEAFVLAVHANVAHGLPLSFEDRTRAAERLIRTHPEWSDRAIAAVVGLGARTVGNVRKRQPPKHDEISAMARTGRDGRVRPLDNTRGRLRVLELMRERPGASMREIARRAGVSPSTVRDVRQRIERGDDPLPASRQRRGGEQSVAAPESAQDGPDPAILLEGLRNDPSLRFTESGRLVLRWIYSRTIQTEERVEAASKVPPHCTDLVANVARAYAGEWLEFADELERRGVQQD